MLKTPVRSKSHFLTFGKPDIQDDEIQEVVASMKSGWLGTGPKVARFEEAFRAYAGAEHAAAVNSCTAALHLSLLAAGVGPGDEVITTGMTFCATVNAILHSGATPVLADIDPRTMNIDPASVRERLTERTRALVPVHFAGRPCDMDALNRIVAEHDLRMVEDCAHAIETTYRGRHVGTFGDFGCFSFYATKNLTTGEGGMVLCREADPIGRIRVLALHGLSHDAWRRYSDAGYRHYYAAEAGFKYNMMDLQAAIGLHQLERVERSWERRREIWNLYRDALGGLPLALPAADEPGTRHAYHLFTVLVDEERTGISRDAFLAGMTENNIGVGVHYVGLPEHPYYRERLGWRPEQVPHATRIGRQTVSLPLSPRLTDRDVQDVIQAVETVLSR
jgi:dTDP-4-amino-4,6-dideoxygalactose transaminase